MNCNISNTNSNNNDTTANNNGIIIDIHFYKCGRWGLAVERLTISCDWTSGGVTVLGGPPMAVGSGGVGGPLIPRVKGRRGVKLINTFTLEVRISRTHTKYFYGAGVRLRECSKLPPGPRAPLPGFPRGGALLRYLYMDSSQWAQSGIRDWSWKQTRDRSINDHLCAPSYSTSPLPAMEDGGGGILTNNTQNERLEKRQFHPTDNCKGIRFVSYYLIVFYIIRSSA